MPYKDPNKRKELIKKHYNSNKDYYKKKANKWKAQNKDKVKESRIRYSEKKKIINELTELQEIYFKSYDGINDKKFDDKFIELARNVYKLNDERAKIKLEINTSLGSNIKEVKSYE